MLVIHQSGGFRLFDNALHDLRVRTVTLPASGELVLVEIDATSLRRLGTWPWPRMHHALTLQRLIDAGAAVVAFDVSFSSPSTPEQDARLAEAARAAGERLILPIFRQLHVADDGDRTLVVDQAIPMLANVTLQASINVVPDRDGIVRTLLPVDSIGGGVVPSMSLALLGPDESTRHIRPEGSIYLDFGIDIHAIPRLSYADVLIGNFDPDKVAGKSVLVGATALELGDVLAVPRWGNLAGPLIVATGFESLRLDRAIRPIEGAWFVFALCLVASLAPAMGRPERPRSVVVPMLLQLAGLFAISEALYVFSALKLDIAAVAAALLTGYGLEMGRMLRSQAERIAAEHRAAKQRDALLRSVVDTSIDSIVITDREGRILIANPACLPVFGYRPNDLVGRAVGSLVARHDPIADVLSAMIARDKGALDLKFPVDVAGLHRDGHELHLDLSIASVGADRTPQRKLLDDRHYILVFRDVSEQRRLEAMRREALGAQLESERSKADFLATASHELRTPLNHIIGFSSLLSAGVGGSLSDKQLEYLSDISAAADHLMGMVTDILAHAQRGPTEAAANQSLVGIAPLIEGALGQVRQLADDREVRISVEVATHNVDLSVNRAAMERVLMHVMRNAVQFSPPHGVVAVRSTQLRDEGMAVIAVSDRGPGMSDEDIARILQPFGQLEDALSRRHGGLGVGLSMAQSCIASHGGRMAVSSTKGMGTTVSILLPVHAAQTERTAV